MLAELHFHSCCWEYPACGHRPVQCFAQMLLSSKSLLISLPGWWVPLLRHRHWGTLALLHCEEWKTRVLQNSPLHPQSLLWALHMEYLRSHLLGLLFPFLPKFCLVTHTVPGNSFKSSSMDRITVGLNRAEIACKPFMIWLGNFSPCLKPVLLDASFLKSH